MEIVWEDPPIPEGLIFSRDLYDQIGFGPTIHELWNFLQSSENNRAPKESSSVSPPAEEHVDNDSIREESSWISGDSEDSSMETEDPKAITEPCKKKQKSKLPFPEPRVPYPCLSALSKTEQRKCLNFLFNHKKEVPLSQAILTKVNTEITQFTMYLQDVSRICAEDYNVISQAALQYSEEVFRSSLEYIKTLPPLYQIHELTSLTGGRFNPELSLSFEKQLLHMGSVDVAHYRPLNSGAQLALDYQTVSSLCPPAKKAKELHTSISSDTNAARLCSSYEPHVCLTRDALVQLLNNHGPEFRDEWELPVLIKTNTSTDKSPKKVFIDSPLLKTKVTVRERSHIYHEESLKLFLCKASTSNVSEVITELPTSEQPALDRSLAPTNSDSVDFEVDLSDLETFGENTSSKTPKKQTKTEGGSGVKSETITHQTRSSSKKESRSLHEEPKKTQSVKTKTSQSKNGEQESDSSVPLMGDSDDDKLFIDDVSPKMKSPEVGSPTTRSKLKRKRCSSGDQLGQILQMQTAMFTSNPSDGAKSSNAPQETSSPSRQPGPSHVHGTSLVKACVTSYLERNPNQEEDTGDVLHSVATPTKSTEQKKLLSQDLQEAAEDECDYERPEEGNLFYKLYSLDELLLLVRTSISFGHDRKLDNQNQCVPLKILPKLEYQLTYGVECLSSSEACQLWTESLLHSSTNFFIAHIDALTSRLALVRRLPDDWVHNISCGFKPSKSLNILHHLLQKLTGLDEGQYLLQHKVGEPFVNILKSAHGNGRPGVYNLQQVHSSIPQPPANTTAPWVPLDPSVCLPFHRQHGRVPCTFPPQDFTPPQKGVTPSHPCNRNNRGGGGGGGRPPGGKKPKKKKTKNKYTPKFKR